MKTLEASAAAAADDLNCTDNADDALKILREAVDDAFMLGVHMAGVEMRLSGPRRSGLANKIKENLIGAARHPTGG